MARPLSASSRPGELAERALEHARAAHAPGGQDDIAELKVADTSFLIDKLGAECGPMQHIREATQNGLDAIAKLAAGSTGRVIWDIDWGRLTESNGRQRKLSVTDTGCGMTGVEMEEYVNALGASSSYLGATGNFGCGLKIAGGWRNPFGLEIRSWQNGQGSLVRFVRTTDGRWGLAKQCWPDGRTARWRPLRDADKPWPLRGLDHGTQVVFLGQSEEDDTTEAPAEAKDSGKRWIMRYLNMRYCDLPSNVEVLVREGLRLDGGRLERGELHRVHGERHHLERRAVDRGAVDVPGARIEWWILDDDPAGRRSEGQEWLSTGHVAACWENELTDVLPPVHGGYTRLIEFGMRWAYERVVLMATPTLPLRMLSEPEIARALEIFAGGGASADQLQEREAMLRQGVPRVESNLARTTLLVDHEPLPWARYAASFGQRMPAQLQRLQEETAERAIHTDLSAQIADRLGQNRRILTVGRYIAPRAGRDSQEIRGTVDSVDGAPTAGELSPFEDGGGGQDEAGGPDAELVAAGDGSEFALVESSPADPGKTEADLILPEVIWVSSRDRSRPVGDLEDRAARFDRANQVLIINGDFRVFRAMEDLWRSTHGHVPGADLYIARSVREWFELALVEVVLAARHLEGSARWEQAHIDQLLSPEALTAAVLPRVAAFLHQKRSLTQRLGRG